MLKKRSLRMISSIISLVMVSQIFFGLVEVSAENEVNVYQNSLEYVFTGGGNSVKIIKVLQGVKKVLIPDTIQNCPVEDVDINIILDVPTCETYSISGSQTHISSENGVLYSKDGSTLIRYPQSKIDEKFEIPSKVTTIEEGAFSRNPYISNIVVGNSVKAIKEDAFQQCKLLETISFGKAVKEIGVGILGECHQLCNITVDASNPNFTADGNVLYNKDKTKMIKYPAKKDGTSYTVPGSIKEIGPACFQNSLVLEKVIFSEGVEEIGDSAFKSCLFISDISIPSTVKSIGDGVFEECNSLKNVTIENSKYFEFYEGGLFDAKRKVLYLVLANNGLTKFVLPKTVKEIKSFAMYKHRSLEEIELNSGLTKIGDYVFGYIHTLRQVFIPRSVASIGDMAFFDCFADVKGYYDSYAYTYCKDRDIDFIPASKKIKAPKVIVKKQGKKYIAKWNKISGAYYQVKVNKKVAKKYTLNLSKIKIKSKKKPKVVVKCYILIDGKKVYS